MHRTGGVCYESSLSRIQVSEVSSEVRDGVMVCRLMKVQSSVSCCCVDEIECDGNDANSEGVGGKDCVVSIPVSLVLVLEGEI